MYGKLMLTMAALLAAAGSVDAGSCESNQDGIYKCSHVELVSSLTRAEIGADDSEHHDFTNDLWGWTDPDDGKEYVIIGMYTGTAFVDISDPENPRFLGRLLSPPATPPAAKSPAPVMTMCHDSCGSGEGEEESTSLWQDVKVYGHYAYIVSEQDWFGMLVFDLHDLRGVTTPQTFTAVNHVRDFRNAHNIFINEETGFAYVVGNTEPDSEDPGAALNFGGLLIYDLSDPENPVQVRDYEDIKYVHDVMCTIYHGPDAAYKDREICFASNSGTRQDDDPDSANYGRILLYDDNTDTFRSDYVIVNPTDPEAPPTSSDDYLEWPDASTTARPFVVDRYAQLTVLDATDKHNITVLSSAQHPNARYVHQSWPTEDHRYLFVNDELDEQSFDSRTHSYTYDISDLDAIKHVATYKAPSLAIDHNEYVNGRLIFQSNYDAGLRILDAADPENLVEVGFFDSRPLSDEPVYDGTWSNYPWFESGVIPFSDMDGGVFFVRHYLEDGSALGSDISVASALLDGGDSEYTYYLAIANTGPGDAEEIDATVHLPAGLAFSSASGSANVTCSAAGRSVTCQVASLPSCAVTVLSLALDNAADLGAEIIGMASARQLDPEGRSGDNRVAVAVADKQASVDMEALMTGLILGTGCTSGPEVDAGKAQSVTAGEVVNLAANATDEMAPLVSYAWKQTAGDSVSLTVANAAATSFTAPSVASAMDLEFSFTVTNAYGATASDTVTVKVMPKPTGGSGGDGGGSSGGGGGGALTWLVLMLGAFAMRRRLA